MRCLQTHTEKVQAQKKVLSAHRPSSRSPWLRPNTERVFTTTGVSIKTPLPRPVNPSSAPTSPCGTPASPQLSPSSPTHASRKRARAVPDSIATSMRRFADYGELKKAALMVTAFQLGREEIKQLKVPNRTTNERDKLVCFFPHATELNVSHSLLIPFALPCFLGRAFRVYVVMVMLPKVASPITRLSSYYH